MYIEVLLQTYVCFFFFFSVRHLQSLSQLLFLFSISVRFHIYYLAHKLYKILSNSVEDNYIWVLVRIMLCYKLIWREFTSLQYKSFQLGI